MTSVTFEPGNRTQGRKSRIPLIFFAFFGVVLIANATMIWIALSSWTGLETRNHYLKGLDYNQTLEDIRAQDALNWTVESELLDAGMPGRFQLVVRVTGGDGVAITADRIIVRLERPTHHGIDQTVELQQQGPGVFSGQAEIVHAGNWNLRRLVWQGDMTHQSVERIFVDPGRVP
ncbi:MAG: FixH family protein [Alphaproteobacteria bacterium]